MNYPIPDTKSSGSKYNRIIYDNSAVKVVVIAIVIMVISIAIFGVFTYTIVKNAIIHKLKTRDLVFTVQSISSKIEARIERAKESSLLLARDPFVEQWIAGGEKDERLGKGTKQKVTDITKHYDYSMAFLTSAVTGHYWVANGKLLDTVSPDDPADAWFYKVTASGNPVTVMIDYNKEYKDTFVFLNVLMGNRRHPVGVAGVGLKLDDISKEFESYKFGKKSSMWLVDRTGKIHISGDERQLGKNLATCIPYNVGKEILSDGESRGDGHHVVVDYKGKDGDIYDLIAQPIHGTDWKLIFQMPRSESTQVVASIRLNTITTSVILGILIIFVFYFISNKIANPYKRAVQLSRELELVVAERTRELQDKNEKIMDSIEYAKLIQETILPTAEEMRGFFKDYFIIWKPRDLVGGDFYWIKKFKDTVVVAVGDCTGHGVPGALMTMAVNSILNYIVDESNCNNPALILGELNRIFRNTINKRDTTKMMDDGLDIGICSITGGHELVYAGAKISLYIKGNAAFKVIPGIRCGIGYADAADDVTFTNAGYAIAPADIFYMTTDGYLSQNGGAKDFSFGKKRFEKVINDLHQLDLATQKGQFENELKNYMIDEAQRDDITVIGFRF